MFSEAVGQRSRQGGVGHGPIRAGCLEEALLAAEESAREGGEKDSLGQGTTGLLAPPGSPSPLPLHPAPHLLPEPLYEVTRWGQGEKGNSYQPLGGRLLCGEIQS